MQPDVFILDTVKARSDALADCYAFLIRRRWKRLGEKTASKTGELVEAGDTRKPVDCGILNLNYTPMPPRGQP